MRPAAVTLDVTEKPLERNEPHRFCNEDANRLADVGGSFAPPPNRFGTYVGYYSGLVGTDSIAIDIICGDPIVCDLGTRQPLRQSGEKVGIGDSVEVRSQIQLLPKKSGGASSSFIGMVLPSRLSGLRAITGAGGLRGDVFRA